jgi:hypothetical protein
VRQPAGSAHQDVTRGSVSGSVDAPVQRQALALVNEHRRRGAVVGLRRHGEVADIDHSCLTLQLQPQTGGLRVGQAAVGQTPPIGDFAGDVVRDAAGAEVRVPVGDHERHLGGRVEFPRATGSLRPKWPGVLRPGAGPACVYGPEGQHGESFRTLGACLPPAPDFAEPPLLRGAEHHFREIFSGTGVDLDFERDIVGSAFSSGA